MTDHPTLNALRHFFGSADNHEAGACVINALLTQIEAAGRRPRLTSDDFTRLTDLFELLHLPGPLDSLGSLVRAVGDRPPPNEAIMSELGERTRARANGAANDANHLPEAMLMSVVSGSNPLPR